ncbi:MAG: hypothetical protein C0467_19375 [Planctomycetaceae bacterium]|nr:hypothetical protein [Planctomycetaceae bacterium]
MPTSAVERAVRVARRRLATQLCFDALIRGWTISLALAVVWLLLEPGRWAVPIALVLVATIVAVVRAARRYPAQLTAALELDSRFGLNERITAAIEVNRDPRPTVVTQAVIADAESHAAGLRVGERFPLGLRRSAWLVPLFAGVLAILAFVWHPITDTHLSADNRKKTDDIAKKVSDNATSPTTFPQPKRNSLTPDKPNAEKLATIRAGLDRLEREAKAKNTTPQWIAELTAAEDAAKSLERDSLDRLSRMETQLKQLEPLAQSPDFKEGPARDTAMSLAKGDLAKAEKSLAELAKAAGLKPNDPELRKQLDKLKDEIRKAAENTATREKLEKLIEQAKKEGRDTSGLQQELDRAKAEQSQPLKDLAAKLDEAAKQLEQGKGDEAAKQIDAAAKTVGEIQKDAQAAEDAQGEAQRAEQMRADATKPGGEQPGAGGVGDKPPPPGKEPNSGSRDVRVRVPFIDPKGGKTPAGSGDFGNNFTKTDPTQLAPAIQNAARSAPAAVAGQPLTPADRAAVREFFERLGK